MKNQLDIIIAIVALVLGGVATGFSVATARKPVAPPAVTQIDVSAVVLPKQDPPMADNLDGTTAAAPASGGGGGTSGGSLSASELSMQFRKKK
jgi:hypothetical protein